MKKLSRIITTLCFLSIICQMFLASIIAQVPSDYKGKPFADPMHKKGIQVIPGRVELSLYDLGGEGIAYHDTDSVNNGSGKLNYEQGCPASELKVPDSYICHFREKESVDISYTKDIVDFAHPNLFEPGGEQLYIGWQADGEWTNYTIDVRYAGKYRITALYGRNDNGSSLWVNNKKAADLTLPINTGDWHSWNKAVVGYITFTSAGLNLLTLHYNAGSNLAYLEFELEDTK